MNSTWPISIAHDRTAGFKKNELKPHLSKYWKIPPEGNAAFVAAMEDVLEVYHLPYNPDYPLVCMDESCKQMIGEVREPIPCKPGQPARIDDEYVRNGVAEIFMEVEPLAGRRNVAVTERRTRKDWALQSSECLMNAILTQSACGWSWTI